MSLDPVLGIDSSHADREPRLAYCHGHGAGHHGGGDGFVAGGLKGQVAGSGYTGIDDARLNLGSVFFYVDLFPQAAIAVVLCAQADARVFITVIVHGGSGVLVDVSCKRAVHHQDRIPGLDSGGSVVGGEVVGLLGGAEADYVAGHGKSDGDTRRRLAAYSHRHCHGL